MTYIKKNVAIILILSLLLGLFSNSFVYATDEKAVKISTGVSGLYVSLEGENLPDNLTAVTDENGDAAFSELYKYLKDTLEWGSEEPLAEHEDEVVVNYEINYPNKPNAEDKYNEPYGNPSYEGLSGSFILTKEENQNEGKVYWEEVININPPQSVTFVEGVVKGHKFNDEDEVKNLEGIKVITRSDKGETIEVVTDENGRFSFYPYCTTLNREDVDISVYETSDYYGSDVAYKNFDGTIKLEEKFVATREHYQFDNSVVDGFVKKPGEIEIYPKDGYSISKDKEMFASSVKVSVSNDGTLDSFYLKKDGKISKEIKESVLIDNTAPTISKVSSVTETEGSDINFEEDGIYTNKDTDLSISIMADDGEGIGIEKVYIIGKKNNNETKSYKAEKIENKDGEIKADFIIPLSSDVVTEEISIVAVDKLGNESQFVLIREAGGSELIAENIAPIVSNITKEGNISKDNWYNDKVAFSFTAQDENSGLDIVKVTINNKEVLNKTFGKRNNKEEEFTYTLTKDLIKELENEKGEYQVALFVKDKAGNETSKGVTVKCDIDAPDIKIEGAVKDKEYQLPPELKISTNEKFAKENGAYINVGIYRNGNKVSEHKYESVAEVLIGKNLTENGTYEIIAYAVDAAGNKSAEETITYIVDDTKPIIMVDGLEDFSLWKNDEVEVDFSVSDNTSGLNKIKMSINGMEVVNETYNKITKEESLKRVLTKALIESLENEKGEYEVVITAVDNAGNKQSISFIIKADIVKPMVALEGAGNKVNYNKAPKITISNNEKFYNHKDSYIALEIKLDGKVIREKNYYSVNTLSFGEDFTENGTYEIKTYAMDQAGNKSNEISLEYILDTAKPAINIKDLDKYSTWKNDEVEINFDVNDKTAGIKTVRTIINNEELLIKNYVDKTFEESYKVTLTKDLIKKLENAKSEYEVIITAVDKAGNEKSESFIILADIVNPVLSLDGVKDKENYNNAPQITISNNEKFYNHKDSYIALKIVYDGKVIEEKDYKSVNTLSFGKDFTENGTYEIFTYAVDQAGNKSNEIKLEYILDTVKPSISVKGLEDGEFSTWKNDKVDVSFDVKDKTAGLKKVQVDINSKEVLNSSFDELTFEKDFAFALTKDLIKELENEKGEYEVTIRVSDKAGNTSEKSFVIKADIVSPEVTIEGVTLNKHYNYSPKVLIKNLEKHFKEEGAYIVQKIYLDNKEISNKTYTSLKEVVNEGIFNNDGQVKILAYAVDAAGNKSAEAQTSFMIDKVSPVITISGADNGKYYNENVEVTITVDEKNFKENAVTIDAKRVLNGKEEAITIPFNNVDKLSEVTTLFNKIGTYTIKVNSVDSAGNKAVSKEITFTVDSKAPEISFTGVTEKAVYKYSDSLIPKVTITEDYFANKTFEVLKTGENVTNRIGILDNGKEITISNIPKTKAFDGIYTINVKASDKSGNASEKSITFTVNRFGSSFSYNDYLNNINNNHIKEVTENIVITELNLNNLTDTKAELIKDGEVIQTEITPSLSQNGQFVRAAYTFNKDLFTKEGVYQINIITRDSAGNTNESSVEAGEVKFFVDKTPPILNVSGLVETYIKGTSHSVIIDVIENLSNAEIIFTVNGKEVTPDETDGLLTYHINEGLDQKIKIVATDKAGNESIFEQEISVSESAFTLFMAQYGYIIIGVAVALCGTSAFVIIKKAKKVKEKNKK